MVVVVVDVIVVVVFIVVIVVVVVMVVGGGVAPWCFCWKRTQKMNGRRNVNILTEYKIFNYYDS